VRFFQRAVLCEVGEDGADGGGSFDAGHDPHCAAAVAARAHVDVDQIAWSDLEQPKAGPGGGQDARSNTRLGRCAKGDRRFSLVLRAQVGVRRKDALKRR